MVRNKDISNDLCLIDSSNANNLFKCLKTCLDYNDCIIVKFDQNQCKLYQAISEKYFVYSNKTCIYKAKGYEHFHLEYYIIIF